MKKKHQAKTEEEIIYPVAEWQRVESFLEEGGLAAYIVALIEAHKILDYYLIKQGYPGATFDERIILAKEKLSNPEKFFYSYKILKNLIGKPKFNTTTLDIEEAILTYRQALIDILGEKKKPLSFYERILVLYHYYLPKKLSQIKKIVLYFFGFLLLVLFLADTQVGNSIVKLVVDFAHFVFSYILAIVLFLAGLAVLIFVFIFYLEKKKRSQQ